MAMVGYAISISLGKTFAIKHGYKVDSNQVTVISQHHSTTHYTRPLVVSYHVLSYYNISHHSVEESSLCQRLAVLSMLSPC